jgi:hypothetical protein
MRRLAPLCAIPVLMGVPLWVETSWPVGVVAAMSGVLCLIAVLRASPSMATVGGTFALMSFAVALRDHSSSVNVLVVTVFGLALLLLAEGTHLCRRFEGAEVAPALWRRHLAWWTGRAAISLGIAAVIAILAPLIAILLPQPSALFVAGIGILAGFGAAVAFVWSGMHD